MPDLPSTDELTDRINHLYWESSDTVDSISDQLGVTKSTLYGSLHALPAGATCPDCGEETVFTNRMSRAADKAVCLSCQSAPANESGMSSGTDSRYEDGSELGAWGRWRTDLSTVPPQRAMMIGGAAALGVVLGAAAVRAIRG